MTILLANIPALLLAALAYYSLDHGHPWLCGWLLLAMFTLIHTVKSDSKE